MSVCELCVARVQRQKRCKRTVADIVNGTTNIASFDRALFKNQIKNEHNFETQMNWNYFF